MKKMGMMMRIFLTEIFRYAIYFLWLITCLTAQSYCFGGQLTDEKCKGPKFVHACDNGDNVTVAYCLQLEGFDPDVTADGYEKENQMFGLFLAAEEGHVETVKLLLAYGANVNQALSDGATSIFIAAQNGHSDVVDLLLDNKTDYTKEWKPSWGVSKSPLTAAKQNCPGIFCRIWNKPKYDELNRKYQPIVTSIENAKIKRKNILPVHFKNDSVSICMNPLHDPNGSK